MRKRSIHERGHGKKKIDFSIRTKMQITSRLEKSSFLSKQRQKKTCFTFSIAIDVLLNLLKINYPARARASST